MSPSATLSPSEVRLVLTTYRDVLRDHQEVVNRLNVYPVPDGDTGTNMALTMESVVEALQELDESVSMQALCHAIAHGSLMGARGNSGVILSQLLRGLCEKFGDVEEVDAPTLASALCHADVLARKAVVRPVEGTILTVAKAAGQGASSAADGTDEMAIVVEAARLAAAGALEATPDLLPALKAAGVVDSGGTGYLLFLDALSFVITGRALPIAPDIESIEVFINLQEAAHDDVSELRYEVMYLLEAPDDTIDAFKEVWAGIGDSIVVVGGDGIFNCHIHTDDIGASIEAALDIGRPKEIRVTDLIEQVIEERWVRDNVGQPGSSSGPVGPPPNTSVVAVVSGDGIGRIFRSLGVQHLVRGGQSMNPSTADLVAAVEATGSPNVVILPNNKNIRPVAQQVDSLCEVNVGVVATNSIVEGFAALLDYDPAADLEDNVEEMSGSATSVIAAEVTQAVRDSETGAGPVREGDWMGLSQEGILEVDDTCVGVAIKLLDRLIGPSHELVTVIEGDGSSAAITRQISEWLHEERPSVSVEVHPGGQPLYPYLFGIE
jgi:DAK2 domain fusion protein YloV